MDWIERITSNPDLMGMGHSQSAEDANLGFGWVYYGLARAYRPKHVVCIGSYRGFTPMMFSKALHDNQQGGQVTFIDPSYVDDFWKDPTAVTDWFAKHELTNITHHKMTTQDFVASDHFTALPAVDFLFVDGLHTAEQAEFDHMSFADKLTDNGLVFFHDSVSAKKSTIYGEDDPYGYSVYEYLDRLKATKDYQLLDMPFADGLTLLRKNYLPGRDRQPDSL